MAWLWEFKAKVVARDQRNPVQYIISCFCFFLFFFVVVVFFFFFFFDNFYCVAAKGPAFYIDIQSFRLCHNHVICNLPAPRPTPLPAVLAVGAAWNCVCFFCSFL